MFIKFKSTSTILTRSRRKRFLELRAFVRAGWGLLVPWCCARRPVLGLDARPPTQPTPRPSPTPAPIPNWNPPTPIPSAPLLPHCGRWVLIVMGLGLAKSLPRPSFISASTSTRSVPTLPTALAFRPLSANVRLTPFACCCCCCCCSWSSIRVQWAR